MEHWNDAMRQIEEQLAGELDVAALARTAHTSEYHFRRMFSSLSGMSLSEYVRRRRLTQATAEILDGAGVLPVAMTYGYGSADAFTRAFKAMHGITPTEARRPGAVLRSQPRMSFHLTIKGRTDMHHRLIELDSYRIVGRMTRIPIVYEGPNTAIAAFQAQLPGDLNDRLLAHADVDALPGLLFVTSNQEGEGPSDSWCDYYYSVATTTPADQLPDDLAVLEVKAGAWVAFRGEGEFPQALQNLWAESFSEWFPSNPYRVVPGPSVLSILDAAADGSRGSGELWLPVEREPATV
ncbi:AraC family transcriptional regulator [Solirubrobacter sp. CPCC 204708]|uniref:AraC family transcriptional regulator n=1 Tax=Solirubrobacter deserti TaxID=2282478 RepID=A0ABT4RVM3_9ACTN|nr:helix-turn-helix domain-containing protein [Solirubrobacter deserti]MBE2321069.1 AraC family transcriptional regulator [Solirubrobacter deserti]MDA0142547.1 AraC family transcriptional regulator [Solirubrobacter deserti]